MYLYYAVGIYEKDIIRFQLSYYVHMLLLMRVHGRMNISSVYPM